MKKFITIAIFSFMIMSCNSSDDRKTTYKSEWENCTVVDSIGSTVTLECNKIIKTAYYEGAVEAGEEVELRTDYEIYREVLK